MKDPTPEELLAEAYHARLLAQGPDAERELRVLTAEAERELNSAVGLTPEVGQMVSARGGKYGYVAPARQDVYLALRRQGMSKTKAARIANGGQTHAQRSRMAKKAARTRKSRGGK